MPSSLPSFGRNVRLRARDQVVRNPQRDPAIVRRSGRRELDQARDFLERPTHRRRVAAATLSVTSTSASLLAGTVTTVLLRLSVCGDPDGIACATLNVAAVEPLLCSLIFFFLLKSSFSSSKPEVDGHLRTSSPSARAVTCDLRRLHRLHETRAAAARPVVLHTGRQARC